jgi:uncharacterized OB-fold protein
MMIQGLFGKDVQHIDSGFRNAVCHSPETEWIIARGNGKIYSYAVYHVALNAAFQGDLPYVTAVVELAEGPRILTNVIGCNRSGLQCDAPVEVVWEDVSDEFSLPKFKIANKGRREE